MSFAVAANNDEKQLETDIKDLHCTKIFLAGKETSLSSAAFGKALFPLKGKQHKVILYVFILNHSSLNVRIY